MYYKCVEAFANKLGRIVDAIIEEGTAQTEDGRWLVPLEGLAGRYGADGDCPSELLCAMLSEREELTGIEVVDGAYRIDFNRDHCAFYQKQLFDPERMQTTAVYTLEAENGPHHFYTEYAGGYSTAYQVAGRLARACEVMEDVVSSEEMMPLLVSDYHFREEKVRLFAPLTEMEAQRLLTADDGKTAFHITLNPAADTVKVAPAVSECSLPTLTLRLHGRGFTCEKLHEIASSPEVCFSSVENAEMDIARLHEKVFRQVISQSLQKFEECSAALEKASQEQNPELAQGGMTLA